MTKEEAKRRQDEISEHYNLGWWYGTDCEKCCDVYPKLMNTGDLLKCYFECEVCGKRTESYEMPWLAKEAWDNGEYKDTLRQLSFF